MPWAVIIATTLYVSAIARIADCMENLSVDLLGLAVHMYLLEVTNQPQYYIHVDLDKTSMIAH